jgi:triosephosphate isomerase (TIM)
MNGDVEGITRLCQDILDEIAESALRHCEVLVLPTFVHLSVVADALKDGAVGVGSQDVDQHRSGAFTGAVSAPMVKDIGCNYAIVGHSERRTIFHEDDEIVAAKFESCLDAGLTPILCVGETLEERQAEATVSVVERQLDAVTARVGAAGMACGLLAYEPIWAIGTGESASPEQAEEVHVALRSRLAEVNAEMASSIRILYGGSVNADNAALLFAMENVDGALVGGASLKGNSFVDICRAADTSV